MASDKKPFSVVRLGAAAAVASLSLMGTAWFVSAAVANRIDRTPQRNIAGLPGDNAAIVARLPEVARQLRGNPMDPDAFNLVYVGIARRDGVRSANAQRAAAILARYGWRSTTAQQNLIESAAYRGDIDTVVDRTDAVMRRDKLRPEMAAVLTILEKDSEQRKRIVARLLTHPNWRTDYLWRIGTSNDPALLDARFKTLLALRDRGDQLSREELSRSLQALLAADRSGQANILWQRTRRGDNVNLIYDTDFAVARREGPRPNFAIPYEWSLPPGTGYSVFLHEGEWPMQINWRGTTAGLPVFASQTIALRSPGRPLILTVKTENPEQLRDNIDFVLSCGAQDMSFSPRAIKDKQITFALDQNVPSCIAPIFSIVGRSGGNGIDALRVGAMRLVQRTSGDVAQQ